jgi:hypothetical protein
MPEHMIKELRGDVRKDVLYRYIKCTPAQLRESYDRCMPLFGI